MVGGAGWAGTQDAQVSKASFVNRAQQCYAVRNQVNCSTVI